MTPCTTTTTGSEDQETNDKYEYTHGFALSVSASAARQATWRTSDRQRRSVALCPWRLPGLPLSCREFSRSTGFGQFRDVLSRTLNVRHWPKAARQIRVSQSLSTPALDESRPLCPELQKSGPGASAIPLIAAVDGNWAKLAATDPKRSSNFPGREAAEIVQMILICVL